MFQSFTATTTPAQGPPRLAAVRAELAARGLDGFLVPRADAHQGEYVAPRDERLAWLTGFTGSAGFCAVLRDAAGLFVDGRYTLQARAQCDTAHFTPLDWPATQLADWLIETADKGAAIAFDPWLHTIREIEELEGKLRAAGLALKPTDNPLDAVWDDQPSPPMGRVFDHPTRFAGASRDDKLADIASALRATQHDAAVITLPDSLCWLLNIRGGDIPRVPVAHGFAVVCADGTLDLFMAADKLAGSDVTFGGAVRRHDPDGFAAFLKGLAGRVRIDRDSAPVAVLTALEAGAATPVFARDPCVLPKACKTSAEIAGARTAHLRDGAAMVEFLSWLDARAEALRTDTSRRLTEIDAVTALEGYRRATNALRDISFDTISGAGPHGAIVHYRVTEATNRAVRPGELLLIDSGGQYQDGTTDITRTIAIGPPGPDETACYTRVLQGLIAVSLVRFPRGLAGRDLDALARAPLWAAGLDYDHGTGHGVGAYLSVHEGPQRLSRLGTAPFRPGMILSNEPGYYREGAFGIRLENLIVVETAPDLPGADDRPMLRFETLTHVPFDRRLIDAAALTDTERQWIDGYHAETRARLRGLVSPSAQAWLDAATAPLDHST